jgi:hypothetical protein
MFKKRIKGWNLFKNLKESEKEEIIRKPQEEEDEIVDHANMLIEGRPVQLHKIRRYQRTNVSQIHKYIEITLLAPNKSSKMSTQD